MALTGGAAPCSPTEEQFDSLSTRMLQALFSARTPAACSPAAPACHAVRAAGPSFWARLTWSLPCAPAGQDYYVNEDGSDGTTTSGNRAYLKRKLCPSSVPKKGAGSSPGGSDVE